MEILRVENLTFSYRSDGQSVPVLRGVSLAIQAGEMVAIQGRSGSGKSTLFHILGCLLRPEMGRVVFEGRDLSGLSADDLALIRNRKIGFVFQQFHLLARASVLDNILLGTLYPAELANPSQAHRDRAIALAMKVGLGEKLERAPNQLSGGEQQRVVIARALMADAPLILADEPTGNLDSKNAENIMALFKELNQQGKTVILITHDDDVARQCQKIYHLQDGRFVDSSRLPPMPAVPVASGTFARERRPSLIGRYWRLTRASVPLAMENLRRNKVRAMLTMAGVTVGIASVFAMTTFGSFARSKILKGYEDMGVNTVMIEGHDNWRRKATEQVSVLFRSFDWDRDVVPLQRIFSPVRSLSPILYAWGSNANYSGEQIRNDVMVLGVNAQYTSIVNRGLQSGRGLTPYHIQSRSPVCLVGPEIQTRLFKGASPLDKILFITRSDNLAYPCRVVGVMQPQTSNKDWRKPNLEIYIPFTYFRLVNNVWSNEMHSFVAQVHAGTDVERIGLGIRRYFEQKYGQSGRFSVDSDVILLAQMKKFLGLFAIMLSAIALITLGVGGMGINNMMLVAISERLKEIGLRKAVGATDRSIRTQFLLESVLLSGLAGVLGVLIGFSGYQLIIYFASKFVSKLSFEWVLEPYALILSVASIVLVGLASGIVPALKAERLQVIEALRSE